MSSSASPATWLSGIAAPLTSKFGDAVTVCRDGNAVLWAYEAQSATIELSTDGRVRATFVDSAQFDAVSSSPAAAVYRSAAPYALDPAGCRRMISDLVDFFSGVREPRFTFVDAFPR